jgi:pimeloyl-ACP methyl ester carboxylesterase
LPWIVLVHGGSANLYEFFVTPRNDPGLGQFLAQKLNVLLVTIPGNYRAGGWMEPPEFRSPQYLLDKDLAPGEVSLRNAIFTNALILTGLKRLISAHLDGDLLIVGHSTGGELSFLAAGDKELGPRCRGRFLGWGSGGPSRWRREWEVATERRARKLREMATFPFVSHLRKRGAEEYVGSGYVGKLNPCEGATPLATASDWLIREGRRRPNFKQVLQDVEHSEAVELRERFEGEIREVASIAPLSIDVEAVLRDLMVPVPEPVGPWQRMAWVVGRADRGHWNEGAGHVAREMFVRDRFAASCPGVAAQVVVVDAPLTHYGHIEAPRELAALLVRTVEGLAG